LEVLANFGSANLQNEARARGALEYRLNLFRQWFNSRPGTRPHYPLFRVPYREHRPAEFRGTQRWPRNVVAVVWASETRPVARMEPHAEVDIGRPGALSIADNPANVFHPVRGVIWLNRDGDRAAVIKMFEAIIIYGLLARASEQTIIARDAGNRPLARQLTQSVDLIAGHLVNTIIADARKEMGVASRRCLDFIHQSVTQISTRLAAPDVRARLRQSSPPKDIWCPL